MVAECVTLDCTRPFRGSESLRTASLASDNLTGVGRTLQSDDDRVLRR